MGKSKRYYWLKLKNNFFDSDEIIWLEKQENGQVYVNLYLKLLLHSAKTCGKLIFKFNKKYNPYDLNDIANITRFKLETVTEAFEIFIKIGFVEIINGIYTLPYFFEITGSEVDSYKRYKKFNKEKRSNAVHGQILCYDTKEIVTSYHDYLGTEHWCTLRNEIISTRQKICEICGKSLIETDINVHHKTYLRVGFESHDDLVICCKDCHNTIHGK